MVEFIPNRVDDDSGEDVQTIQKDINALATKYILPIDRIRSLSRPNRSEQEDDFDNLDVGNEPFESRCHAFYRFIGFPVAVPGAFYNPGFDPTNSQNIKKKKNVNSKFKSATFRTMMDERESDSVDLKNIFKKRDIVSAVYALLLKHVRKIQVLNKDLGPFDVDKQNFDIDSRKQEADSFFNDNPNLNKSEVQEKFSETAIGINFTSGRHILRPFIVNPIIENTVMPDRNKVTVPFLPDKTDTKIEENVNLLRPGLELIIRERLRDNANEATAFLDNIRKIAENETSQDIDTSGLNENILRLTVESLLGDSNIDSSTVDELTGISTIQVKNITQLVKTIKAILFVLYESITLINLVSEKINWVPIPSAQGPELGERGALLARNQVSINYDIDRKIAELKINLLAAKNQTSQNNDLGNYASPFSATVNDQNIKKISEELQILTEKRNKIASAGLKAMGNIELIMGEVSGLGLIDILSIYIALWAMDEEALINLLDEESFLRMVIFFPNLKVGAAESRLVAGISKQAQIDDALESFEESLINVLTFVEREFSRQFVAPGEIPGGQISE